MTIIHFLNGVTSLIFAILCFYLFFIWYKHKTLAKIGRLIGICGIINLIPSYLNIAWAFNILSPNPADYLLLEGILNVIRTTILLIIIYQMMDNKSLLYIFFLYIFSALAVFINIGFFFYFISGISFVILILPAAYIIHKKIKTFKVLGYLLFLYSFLNILYLILIYLGFNASNMAWFATFIIFILIFYTIYRDLESHGIGQQILSHKRKQNLLFFFVSFVFYIAAMSSFIFLSTVSIHEMGHAIAAKYYNCERGKAIIYDTADSPHTEMVCKEYYNNIVLTISGVILTLIVAIIFLTIGNRFTVILSYLIIGFSLLISYGDLIDLGASKNIIVTVILLANLFIVLGIVKLSIFFIKSQSSIFNPTKDAVSDNNLWLDENTCIKDLYDLFAFLKNISDKKYTKLARENVIVEWLKKDKKEIKLADKISKLKNKTETETLILIKLLKDRVPEKTIVRYLCKPRK